EGSRTRRFGRGSRSQVGGVAPRPSPQPGGAPGEWPDAAGPGGREPPARPTVSGRTTVGGRASQPEQRPQRDHPQAAPPATGTSPPRARADEGPSAAPNRRAARGDQGDRAGAASASGDQIDTPERGRPTAMELLAGIGGTPAAADPQPPLHEPDIGAPVGLGRGPFQGHPTADLQTAQGASSSSPTEPAPPETADSGSPIDRGEPAEAETRPAAAAASAAWGPAIGHAHGPDADDLPQRRRGESLPSGLRGEVDEQPQRSASAAPVSREESRSLLSSYQSRLQAGRKAAEDQVARSRKPTPATPGSTPADGDPTPSWGEAGPDEAP
ncbi:MAG TPA: hypothetical protein VMM13_07285, partial [Euzebya sp.]|nr:hypothetical protein [Euzebya sp.]